MRFSVLRSQNIHSPIDGMKSVRPEKGKGSRILTATLVLTSLVDAFSILVIYLLLNSSSATTQIEIDQGMQLPRTDFHQALKDGIGVKVVPGGGYILDKKRLNGRQLRMALEKVKKETKELFGKEKNSLIVQADKRVSFDNISPLLAIASDAGIEEIKFATLGGGS